MKTADNAPNIKGPGPKIKTRDGSKVLVTELLKSREGIVVFSFIAVGSALLITKLLFDLDLPVIVSFCYS